MLKLTVDLNAYTPEIEIEREVERDNVFDVTLTAEAHQSAREPIEFDTIILEILYNDQGYVIGTDPMARPIAGEIATDGTIDFFSREPVTPGTLEDRFTRGSLLTLRPSTGDPSGLYKTATGRAGISNLEKPFRVVPGERPVVVVAGRMGTALGTNLSTSSIFVTGQVYYRSKPIATESVLGQVTVVDRNGSATATRGTYKASR